MNFFKGSTENKIIEQYIELGNDHYTLRSQSHKPVLSEVNWNQTELEPSLKCVQEWTEMKSSCCPII